MTEKIVKIGLVAGEISGDLLGEGLIRELKKIYPYAEFKGLGGEKMIAAGFESLFPMDRLSVMGFVEPLKRLPELLRIRRTLYRSFIDWGADLVVGIDSPDFNLGLELKLRRRGIRTAHYVSPSVWAWRRGRVRKISRAVDRMLTLFPFESAFYEEHGVPVTFVGHPLADTIPLRTDHQEARVALGLSGGPVLAIMPGSRAGEIHQMCELFLQVARELSRRYPELQFVIPAANDARFREIEETLQKYPELPLTLLRGRSHQAMAASDAVLLTSGTTALEAMLLKRPMVVAYRLGGLSYKLLKRLVKAPYISLPNLIADEVLVPELIQEDACLSALVEQCEGMLFDNERRHSLQQRFHQLHQALRQNASVTAANALSGMLEKDLY